VAAWCSCVSPSKVQESRLAVHRDVTVALAASREVGDAAECCMWRSTGPIGLPDPAVTSPSAWQGARGVLSSRGFVFAVFHAPPFPDTVKYRVHPLVRLASSSECLEPSSDRRLPTPIAFHEVSFPIATSTGRVHLREPAPKLASFRPRRFARPRRLAPLPVLRVCFTPQPRPGFTLQGFLPPASPYELVARRDPHAVAVLSPGRRLPDDATATTPDLGALLDAEIRRRSRTVSPRPARSPPELHLPRVLLRAPRRRRLGPLLRPWPFAALDVLTVRDLIDPFRPTSPVQGS